MTTTHHHSPPQSGAVASEIFSGWDTAPTQYASLIIAHNLEPKNRCLLLPPAREPCLHELQSLLGPDEYSQRRSKMPFSLGGSDFGRRLPSHRRIQQSLARLRSHSDGNFVQRGLYRLIQPQSNSTCEILVVKLDFFSRTSNTAIYDLTRYESIWTSLSKAQCLLSPSMSNGPQPVPNLNSSQVRHYRGCSASPSIGQQRNND